MKRILSVLFLFFSLYLLSMEANAIQWIDLTTPRGRPVCLDKDSITQYKSYYLYNIMFVNLDNGNTMVATIQSGINRPFSATLKTYTPEEYKKLNGDYSSMAQNITKNLEPVTFDSAVYTAYKRVKDIKQREAISTVNLGE